MSANNVLPSINNRPKFKEEEYVAPFLDHLLTISQEIPPNETITVYRTQHNIPIDDYGQTPNALRARKGTGRKISHKYTKEEIDKLTIEERTKAIGKFGLSCNPTIEAAEASVLEGLRKLIDRGASEKEIEEFFIKRGEHICKFIITSEVALITKFRNQHANIYLYEGVDLEDCRDKSFEPHKIDYQSFDE